MSGGSMEYLYRKVEYASFREDTPLRRAFRAHLKKVAKALHDIEWVDSGDYGDGDDEESMRACLSARDELEHKLDEVRVALTNLNAAIARAGGKQ